MTFARLTQNWPDKFGGNEHRCTLVIPAGLIKKVEEIDGRTEVTYQIEDSTKTEVVNETADQIFAMLTP